MSIDSKESLYKQLERSTDRKLLNLLQLIIDELNSTEGTNLTLSGTLTANTVSAINQTVEETLTVNQSITSPSVEATDRYSLTINTDTDLTGKLITIGRTQTIEMTGASVTTTFDIPTKAKLIGFQYIVTDAVVFAGGGANFSIDYTGGSSQAVASLLTGTLLQTNNYFYNTNTDSDITTNTTNLVFTPDAGTFDGGSIEVIVYYSYFNTVS